MRYTKYIFLFFFYLILSVYQSGCSFLTYTSVSKSSPEDSSASAEPEPNYNVTLDFNYQDFTSYLYMGNRVENFTAYFNTFFRSNEDYQDAFDEYRASLISNYNRRLDSLGVSLPVSGTVKEKLDKSIERASKIIQFHKFSKYIDDAVLIIGKSYFIEADYYKAERTFKEFLSKFSSSVLADEAILYLGRTKVKLGKIDEGEFLFKDLAKNSTNKEIQSLASRDLGILEYNKGKYQEAVNYFRASIDYSDDNERKAESQFILAKILFGFKPEQAAEQYKKVLDYTSDYDLTFYARLNYAKGLIHNKDYTKAADELESLRKKYRDEPAFTQLVDLETANNLYDQNEYIEANNKYYEVIVKYPNSASSSDAYYYLAKNEEEVNNDYFNALVNYKKAVEENTTSDYYKESLAKSTTLLRYFTLLGDIGDSVNLNIPTENVQVENYRRRYNEEKGINQPTEGSKDGTNPPPPPGNGEPPNTGKPKGDETGKPGGFKSNFIETLRDSLKESPANGPADNPSGPADQTKTTKDQRQEDYNKRKKQKELQDSLNLNQGDSLNNNESVKSVNQDSINAAEEALKLKIKEDKIFNSYYEIAEIFIYSLAKNDSAEYYLKLLLRKFPESSYKQSKVLYTLGNFYKNTGRNAEAEEIFNRIISTYPNSIYTYESKKILGIKTEDFTGTLNPVDKIFTHAMGLFNEKKYPEAILKLQEVELKHPDDSLVAKALYSIGWIYENCLENKDSSLFYYKKLKAKFPASEYTMQVTSLLDYMASLEVTDSTAVKNTDKIVSDSSNAGVANEENKKEEVANEKKEENTEVVKADTTNANKENRLSQEEIDKLLKEGDEGGK